MGIEVLAPRGRAGTGRAADRGVTAHWRGGWLGAAGLLLALVSQPAATARACGGFFCNTVPVDQAAERVLFAVGPEYMTMVVQVRYQGAAEDFAWLLPLGDVPLAGSLQTFPGTGLLLLDQMTDPRGPACPRGMICLDGGPDVRVHEETVVGPYEAAVIESRDAGDLVSWLRDHGYRVSDAMVPRLALYAAEGARLLALRLRPGLDAGDIQPIAITMPSGSPTIPLRLTAVAAEPEMGIQVYVAADRRYEPANWPELTLDGTAGGWEAAVARRVDRAGGHGFVVEWAGPSSKLLDLLQGAAPSPGRDAMVHVLSRHPYVTRLYTRLSAEEMTSDPILRRSSRGDVEVSPMWSGGDPCLATTCGAMGLCLPVSGLLGGCACLRGAVARASSTGDTPCIDRSLSFLQPGDVTSPGTAPLPDPCVGVDCGFGECVAVNMTPTCSCDAGYVAIRGTGSAGPSVRCVRPAEPVPDGFYDLDEVPPDRLSAPPAAGCSISRAGGHDAVLALTVLATLWMIRRRR